VNKLLLREAREVWEVIQEVVPPELAAPESADLELVVLGLARRAPSMEKANTLPVTAGHILVDRVRHTLVASILILNPTAGMVFIKNRARVPVR
jgi:hypothetical protein